LHEQRHHACPPSIKDKGLTIIKPRKSKTIEPSLVIGGIRDSAIIRILCALFMSTHRD
jgi:hypothetical protein